MLLKKKKKLVDEYVRKTNANHKCTLTNIPHQISNFSFLRVCFCIHFVCAVHPPQSLVPPHIPYLSKSLSILSFIPAVGTSPIFLQFPLFCCILIHSLFEWHALISSCFPSVMSSFPPSAFLNPTVIPFTKHHFDNPSFTPSVLPSTLQPFGHPLVRRNPSPFSHACSWHKARRLVFVACGTSLLACQTVRTVQRRFCACREGLRAPVLALGA